MKQPLVLRVHKDAQLVGVKQFIEDQVVFGRGDEVQIDLPDPAISPIHALIEKRDSGYYLCDLGSRSGTLLNGEKILDVKIQSNDCIQLGPFSIVFYVGVPKPNRPPPDLKSDPKENMQSQSANLGSGLSEETKASGLNLPPLPDPLVGMVDDATPVTTSQPSQAQLTSESRFSGIQRPSKPPLSAFNLPAASPFQGSLPPYRKPFGQPAPIITPTVSINATSPAPPPEQSRPEPLPAELPGTFAPPSEITNLKEIIKPGRGSVVEVVMACKERVVATYHFSGQRVVTLGSHPKCDIMIPSAASKLLSMPFIQIGQQVAVLVNAQMVGEQIRGELSYSFAELLKSGKMARAVQGYAIFLDQAEMLKIDLPDLFLTFYIRYVPETPKTILAPILDLTASEVTGLVMAIAIALVLALYVTVYSPQIPIENVTELAEPQRRAFYVYKERIPVTTQKQTLQVKSDQKQEAELPREKMTRTEEKEDAEQGQASRIKPKNITSAPKKITSVQHGGAIKTGQIEGAQPTSVKKDVTDMGLLSVLGTKGVSNSVAKAYAGAGTLQGLADQATGAAGQTQDRAESGIGSDLKDTGAGDQGIATVGIKDIGTKGKGSGRTGYGQGSIGGKETVTIIPGGSEEEFSESIDRDAIRRVIQSKLRELRSCYERELNKFPDLYGKIILQWEIGAKGYVGAASVKSSTLDNSVVASCVIGRLKTWRFPEPPSNIVGVVTYPFVFSQK